MNAEPMLIYCPKHKVHYNVYIGCAGCSHELGDTPSGADKSLSQTKRMWKNPRGKVKRQKV